METEPTRRGQDGGMGSMRLVWDRVVLGIRGHSECLEGGCKDGRGVTEVGQERQGQVPGRARLAGLEPEEPWAEGRVRVTDLLQKEP